MTREEFEAFAAQAAGLPQSERAEPAARLLRCLDPPGEDLSHDQWWAAWRPEIERRAAEADAGVPGIPASEVMAKMASRLRRSWPRSASGFVPARRVEYRGAAEQELAEAIDWYASEDPDLAERFAAAVDRIVGELADHPAASPPLRPIADRHSFQASPNTLGFKSGDR